MAQRLIHQLFAEKIITETQGLIRSPGRFTFGCLLPDAYGEEDLDGDLRRAAARRTHFRKSTPDKLYRYFDYAEFFGLYEKHIRTDDMYLGYYIHLVEDSYYREFIHNHRGIPRAATNDILVMMHRDYRLLNSYIMKRYGLRDDVKKPDGFENEPINIIYPFDAELMLTKLREDYTDDPEGTPHYIDGGLLNDYLRLYLDRCTGAVRAVRSGGKLPDPLDSKWSAGEYREVL